VELRLMALLVSRVQIETAIWSHHQPREKNHAAESEPPWGETRTECFHSSEWVERFVKAGT
jgi:hypothetical protein